MDKADALGLQLFRAHRRYQLSGSARREYERDDGAMARIAPRGRDEIGQRCGAFAAGNPTATVGILATGHNCSIRRVRVHENETCWVDAGGFLFSYDGADPRHRPPTNLSRLAHDLFGHRRLKL